MPTVAVMCPSARHTVSAAAAPVRAVVVRTGSDGERVATGLGLAGRGVAPTLAVSNGADPDLDGPPVDCGQTEPCTVVCFRPSPQSTYGEARTVAGIAQQRERDRIAVVTSTYHEVAGTAAALLQYWRC